MTFCVHFIVDCWHVFGYSWISETNNEEEMSAPAAEAMTIQEAATSRRVGPKTIWRWIRSGVQISDGSRIRLRAAKLGGAWRIDPADLEEFSRRLTESALK